MELKEKKKREHLIDIIELYLETNVALMEYYKAVADTRKGKLACTKSIKSTLQAIDHLRQIKHIELLDFLYSSFIGNNVIAYSVSGKVVLSKKLAFYDTEDGFVEFLKEQEERKKQALAKEQEKIKTEETIKKAKEEGKKVEMVWDKETKTVKPFIVEDNAKA